MPLDPALEQFRALWPTTSILGFLSIPTGRNGRTSCPLCNATNRAPFSFDAYRWHCFACDRSGSSIGLLMEIRGCSFLDALALLGFRLPSRFKRTRELRTPLARKSSPEFSARILFWRSEQVRLATLQRGFRHSCLLLSIMLHRNYLSDIVRIKKTAQLGIVDEVDAMMLSDLARIDMERRIEAIDETRAMFLFVVDQDMNMAGHQLAAAARLIAASPPAASPQRKM